MNLFQSTLVTGIFLILMGIFVLAGYRIAESLFKGMLRSRIAAVVFMTAGGLWFLWKVSNLGPAEFGNHKQILLILFFLIAFLSFFTVPDFLSVRGLSILTLLTCDAILDTAYMQDPTSRLFLVSFVYLVIVACIYMGAIPYRMRDFLNWAFHRSWRAKAGAYLSITYGLALMAVAFTY